ncbi:MAG TPA: SDR family oxidoreductase, partial [Gammaproteobacteria bacterium]|nr:SDR family oxidoreductase [Gammaproteobacteria bacterium]
MVQRKSGVVLNVSSVHEVIPWSGYSAYTASKAGLAMLTKTLAQEAAPHGVRVLAIAPGAIRTPINEEVWSDHSMLNDLLAKIPEGRMGSVEDVADVAVLLASDAARYMTGSSVYVDGGMTLFPSFTHGG